MEAQGHKLYYSYHSNIGSYYFGSPPTYWQEKWSFLSQANPQDKFPVDMAWCEKHLFVIQITEGPACCTANVSLKEMQHGMRGITHKWHEWWWWCIQSQTRNAAFTITASNLADRISVCVILSPPCICSCIASRFSGTFLLSRRKHPKARFLNAM